MIKKLPDAELLVMNVVWDAKDPIPTNDILEIVNERYQRAWTSSTLQSLLNRLLKRKFIISKRLGKFKYYWALVEKEAYLQAEMVDFISLHYNGSAFDMVATLCKTKALSAAEIEKLRDMLK